MAFRRSFEKIESSNIKRRAVLLTALVFVLAFFLQTWLGNWISPTKTTGNALTIHFLSDTTYLVEADTTNYDQFASVLRKAIAKAKKEYKKNYIKIVIPKTKKVGAIADIILAVNAMNLKIELTTEP